MTDKSTQNIYLIRRMRNGVFINMIVEGYEICNTERDFSERGTKHYGIQKRKTNNNYKHCETGQRDKSTAV